MMKKYFPIAALIVIAGIFLFSSCKKDDEGTDDVVLPDTGKPVISLTGGSKVYTVQFTAFSDPGSVVTDNVSQNLVAVVTGSVHADSACTYTLTYTATDAAGNTAEATRTVVVDGADYVAGFYTVEDYTGSTSNGSYAESVTSSSVTDNRIQFSKFGFYSNGNAYGNISGTTITIPQQTISCGMPVATRTFAGSGIFAKDFTSFTINYTETTNGSTYSGHGVYTRL